MHVADATHEFTVTYVYHTDDERTMTSFVAWLGTDQRGPASLYFAADSRISWGAHSVWDHGRKVFACAQSPRLFGYVGDVLFPSMVLSQVVSLIDSGVILATSPAAEGELATISKIIHEAFARVPNDQKRDFTIVYSVRRGDGMSATFHVFTIDYFKGAWSENAVPLPASSGPVTILGSGGRIVSKWHTHWSRTKQGGTSRAVFSAFCDAVRRKEDVYTGGAPQLVGMYRINPAKKLGVVYGGRAWIYGMPLPAAAEPEAIEWRNELFELCDVTGTRLPDAQRHAAPRGLGPTH